MYLGGCLFPLVPKPECLPIQAPSDTLLSRMGRGLHTLSEWPGVLYCYLFCLLGAVHFLSGVLQLQRALAGLGRLLRLGL